MVIHILLLNGTTVVFKPELAPSPNSLSQNLSSPLSSVKNSRIQQQKQRRQELSPTLIISITGLVTESVPRCITSTWGYCDLSQI